MIKVINCDTLIPFGLLKYSLILYLLTVEVRCIFTEINIIDILSVKNQL
jgi:hypothetical protein